MSSLREAAISHLARFSASQAGLARVLARHIARWEKRASDEGAEPEFVQAAGQRARSAIDGIIAALVAAGALDDAAFARSRVRSLSRAGRSSRAIAAHLAERGVDRAIGRSAIQTACQERLEDPAELELAAALIQARRRRIGPFGEPADDAAADPRVRVRALAALARAGFSQDTASRALATDRETADTLIARLRG